MSEKVFLFGSSRTLVGVLTEPEQAVSGDVGVVFLNAGFVHRVGPFRGYVELARRLAKQGYPVFRFDLSGIGDSALYADQRSDDARAVAEVREAMTFLENKRGLKRFILIGLCSGAYNAHVVSVEDTRVAGAIFLDGYGFRTRGYYLRKALGLLNPARIARFLMRQFRGLVKVLPGGPVPPPIPPAGAEDLVISYSYPRERFISEIRALAGRGLRMLFIYTGGVHYYNYRGQFADVVGPLPKSSRVEVDYYPDADHTYPVLSHRERLMSRLADWLRREFPVS